MKILVALLALVAAGSAQAYSWPLKPFNRQHPVGGNFGDPRMTFLLTLGQNGLEGPGVFAFHNGIDIHAKPGTPVYPIASGRAHLLSGTAVAVKTPGHPTFQYFHLKLAVHNGQPVRQRKTVLGYITVWAKHVHLSEIAHGRALNPLERGRIEVFADAFDLPEPLPGFTLRLPVSPAEVSWTLRRAGGGVVRHGKPVDFRGFAPPNSLFWCVYGRGTYPNGPVFGGRLYKQMPGRYLFRLTPHGLDTRRLADGAYMLRVTARDVRGNRGRLTRQFDVVNH